jgi:hypothetical protein
MPTYPQACPPGSALRIALPRLEFFKPNSREQTTSLANYDYCAMIFSFIGVARLRPLPRESIRVFGPGSPKEQPPRNLSGERTAAGGWTLWKAAGGNAVPPKG